MKTHWLNYVFAGAICLAGPMASAQSLGLATPVADAPGTSVVVSGVFEAPVIPLGRYQVPAVRHVPATMPDQRLVVQDAITPVAPCQELAAEALGTRSELPVLVMRATESGLESAIEELRVGLALVAAIYQPEATRNGSGDCPLVAAVVERRVTAEPAKVLEILESALRTSPNCACEIVKAAIKGSEADATLTVAIVETACAAAPDMMRIVSQCAIAMVPDSLAGVQAVLAKLDPNAGKAGYSAKDSKDAKGTKVVLGKPDPVPAYNPLDLPPYTFPIIPPPIFPPPVTTVTTNGGAVVSGYHPAR